MKTFNLELTREQSTTIRVRVPDDFDPGEFRDYLHLLSKADDWSDDPTSTHVRNVAAVADDGEFAVVDLVEDIAAEDDRQAKETP